MTTIPFPANRIASTDRRAEIEALARELGGVVIWPTYRKTARDCILEVLGCRVAMTTPQIAAAANVSYGHTKRILHTLRCEGLVLRQQSRKYGGWLLSAPLQNAA